MIYQQLYQNIFKNQTTNTPKYIRCIIIEKENQTYKLIQYYTPQDEPHKEEWEFFNLSNDSCEIKNLIKSSDHYDLFKTLKDLLLWIYSQID